MYCSRLLLAPRRMRHWHLLSVQCMISTSFQCLRDKPRRIVPRPRGVVGWVLTRVLLVQAARVAVRQACPPQFAPALQATRVANGLEGVPLPAAALARHVD